MEPFSLGTTRQILLVEPSALTIRHLAMHLQKEGYELYMADTVEEAQSMVNELSVDLVLISSEYPNQASMYFVQALKKSARTFSLPVVMMFPGQDQADLYLPAIKRGLFLALAKPIDSQVLFKLLDRIYTPLPEAGNEVILETDGHEFALMVEEPHERRLLLAGPHEGLLTGTALKVSFLHLGLARAYWSGTVTTLEKDTAIVVLDQYLGKDDQRRFLRKDKVLPVRYRLAGDHYRLANTLDISAGGVRLAGVAQTEVPLGSRIELSLILDKARKLDLEGEVRRIMVGDVGNEWGVAFIHLTSVQQEKLFQLIFDEIPVPLQSSFNLS